MPMKRDVVEIGLVLLMAAAFGVCDSLLHAKGPFIAACGTFWIGYILVRCRREPGVWREWGFGTANLLSASLAAGAAVAVGAAGVLLDGATHQGVRLPTTAWILVPLYLPWGLLQQFLLNAIVARNLVGVLRRAGTSIRVATLVAVAVAAVLFGLVHLPDLVLTALCTAAGAVWVAIYLRWRNLWPLGLSHVVLGVLAYYVVLRRDPLAEIVAALHSMLGR
jgi:hypothetical protein